MKLSQKIFFGSILHPIKKKIRDSTKKAKKNQSSIEELKEHFEEYGSEPPVNQSPNQYDQNTFHMMDKQMMMNTQLIVQQVITLKITCLRPLLPKGIFPLVFSEPKHKQILVNKVARA